MSALARAARPWYLLMNGGMHREVHRGSAGKPSREDNGGGGNSLP
jgi:hypothetical protein